MSSRPPHGTVRPGGRTSRTRTAVLDAASAILEEGGYSALTMRALTDRSGVHVSTIRRRWHTVEAVVAEVLKEMSETLPVPDTGDLRSDLRELALAIAGFHADAGNRNLIEGMVAAAVHDEPAAEVLRDSFLGWTGQATEIVHRAVARGQVPPDTDATEVIDSLSAAFCYRLMVMRRPIDARLTETSAEAAYWSAASGAFGRSDAFGRSGAFSREAAQEPGRS
ncbi:TetR/AcrR family transcriptional regulator [Streptomyces piniterrae]|uniref:TetR/AcrR family transcriptional regulator n=1 Tax=Streptomyces piniterrae TaxID=2571125 RepID=A0A4U0NSI4_9ACTN|nr:TetR/AcrR family transcriptional regulator [Streptomyces piniterrae]TJZ57420.1 TetR/AcrR family transcriptional regulator [Streptomyces piniterrae]